MGFNQYIWSLYKESFSGLETINCFKEQSICLYDIINKYNPKSIEHWDKDTVLSIATTVADNLINTEKIKSIEDAELFFYDFISNGISDGTDIIVDKYDYKTILNLTTINSFLLNSCAPDYFIPFMFLYRSYELNMIFDLFGLKQPKLPKKSDYKARCMYYMELCKVFYKFRIDNNLTSEEICAFLYDFAVKQLPTIDKSSIPKPSQAWFIGGLIHDNENNNIDFWQANKDTKRGDIMVHYETSPISAITHIWIAQTDGVIDPFFHFYSNSYISQCIEIPHITLTELKNDEYFKNNSLVRKSFQGVNGFSISSEDYSRIKYLLQLKGYIGELPSLYSPIAPNVDIRVERDVEIQLVEYYLTKMGFEEGLDYIRQLPIHAGRGSRIYPDYALHYDNTPDYETSKVLIEVKLYMKNSQMVEECFKQAYSYAKILESNVIVLCDKEKILVYEKKSSFNRYEYKTYYWEDFNNPDRFNELKHILSK